MTYKLPSDWENSLGTVRSRTATAGKKARHFIHRNSTPQQRQQSAKIRASQSYDQYHKLGNFVVQLKVDNSVSENGQPIDDISESDGSDSDDGESRTHELYNIILDEEWDTRTFGKNKAMAAFETLAADIEHSHDQERRKLAIRMITRLVHNHPDKKKMFEEPICSLANKAFFSIARSKNVECNFRVAELLAVISEDFSDKLSIENAVGRSILFIVKDMDNSARVIQHIWRGILFERSILNRDFPADAKFRRRCIYQIKYGELIHQRKLYYAALKGKAIPDEVILFYLKIILNLVKDGSSAFVQRERNKAVRNGALVIFYFYIRKGRLVGNISKEILQFLCKECTYITKVLESDILNLLANELKKIEHNCFEESLDNIMLTLAIIDSLTSSVVQSVQENSLLEDDDQAKTVLQSTISNKLASNNFISSILHTIKHSNAEIKFSCLSILRNISSCDGYDSLLEHLIQGGGRYLENVLNGMNSNVQCVHQSCLAFLAQMTTKGKGREAIIRSGGANILMKLCVGGFYLVGNSYKFVIGLTGLILLASEDDCCSSNIVRRLNFYASPSVALNNLYLILMEFVRLPTPLPDKIGLMLLSFEALPHLIDLLVEPLCNNESSQTTEQRSMSSIILFRLTKQPQIARSMFCISLIEHLIMVIQTNHTQFLEGEIELSNSLAFNLFVESTEKACRTLTNLTKCSFKSKSDISFSIDDGIQFLNKKGDYFSTHCNSSSAEVIISFLIITLHALEDIVSLIQSDSSIGKLMQNQSSVIEASLELLGSISPFVDTDFSTIISHVRKNVNGLSIQQIVSRIIDESCSSILNILAKDTIYSIRVQTLSCRALYRLCSSNISIVQILEKGCIEIISKILPHTAMDNKISKNRALASSKSKRKSTSVFLLASTLEDDKLNDVPYTLYTLLSKLASLPEARHSIARMNIIPRITKRLFLASCSPQHDLKCYCEILLFISIVSNTNTSNSGSVNEIFLQCNVPKIIVDMMHLEPENSKTLSKISDKQLKRLQLNASKATYCLSKDVMSFVPCLVNFGVLQKLSPVLERFQPNESDVSTELLRPILGILVNITSYPLGKYHEHVTKANVMKDLMRIGCNFELEMSSHSISNSTKDTQSLGDLARKAMSNMGDSKQEHLNKEKRSLNSAEKMTADEGSSTIKDQDYNDTLCELPYLSPCKTPDRISKKNSPLKSMNNHGKSNVKNEFNLLSTRPLVQPNLIKHPSASQTLSVNQESLLKTRPPGKPNSSIEIEQIIESTDCKSKKKFCTDRIDKRRSKKSTKYKFARPLQQTENISYQLLLDPVFNDAKLLCLDLNHGDEPLKKDKSQKKNGVIFHSVNSMGHQVTVKNGGGSTTKVKLQKSASSMI